jgi:hypothetical protein
MRLPQRSYRLIAPVFFGLQALVLVSCEPSRTLDPLSADELSVSAQRNGGRRVHEMTLSAPDSSLTPSQQVQATVVVKDQRGRVMSASRVAWAAAKQEIATVSSTGLVTGGEDAGSTTISASMDGVSRTMTVSVAPEQASDTTSDAEGDTTSTDPEATAGDTTTATPDGPAVHMISITANATTLKVGEATQVSGVVRAYDGTPVADVPITWSTSPTTVATVAGTSTSAGLLTAKGVGQATVYAYADTVVRSITVNVIDSATTAPPTTPSVPSGASGGSYGSATAAELPRATVNTAYPAPARQIRVPAGASLQNAIDAAQAGDELLLAPGAVYTGNFYLRNKGVLSGWITIRTDVSDASIGAPGTRMTPSRAASANLARIVTPNIYSAITTELGANHYRFTGVEFAVASSVTDMNVLVRLGENLNTQNSAATTAGFLIFDRTYIHGNASGQLKRCVMLNSATTAIVDSWLGDCHSNVSDSQAIVGWNGPGPFLIQNNHLEAGHEVIMFGGGGVTTQNVSPSDITIRGNHIMRPTSWKGVWQVKNLIESKHARRMLIEGNVIENTWADAQAGFAFVMKSENQDWNTPWTQTTDITIRHNKIRNVGGVFNLAANPSGAPAVPAARFVITDNVVENVGTGMFGGDGRTFQLLPGLSDVVLMHNTVVSASGQNPAAIYLAGGGISRLVVHSNVLHHGNAGVKGDGTGEGSASLNTFASGALYTNNAMVYGGTASSYPANNWFPSTLADLGFLNAAGGDYHLGGSSAFAGKGYDGRNVGADIDQVDAATRNAVVAP